jgi:L-rhamnose mutarotase
MGRPIFTARSFVGREAVAYRAYIGRIRMGREREYIEVHRAVWPALIDAMKNAGVDRESCFVLGNYIFVYVEAADIDATMETLARNPISQKWETFIESLVECPIENRSEFFAEMNEVFRM